MSDLRPDLPHGSETGSVVRDAKIEELLLVGLDHYFAGQYEQAVNVWTRVLFLDRGHTRARAYIERARNAIAERQRESEEMLQAGIAAFERGDVDQARRLLETSVERGGPSDLASAFLTRLTRRDSSGTDPGRPPTPRVPRPAGAGSAGKARAAAPWRMASLIAGLTLAVGIAGIAVTRGSVQWLSLSSRAPRTPPVTPRTEPLRVPRAAESAMTRARALYVRGHLHEALIEIDRVHMADPLRADADRLKADIQRALIETSSLTTSASPARRQ